MPVFTGICKLCAYRSWSSSKKIIVNPTLQWMTPFTLAIGPIAEEIVGTPLRVGVVNREREATPETPTWNVVIVTTGIARRWLQDDLIGPEDTLIVDEIHQTSAELELCLALGKRIGCRFIWLSATVDPSFYRRYLDSVEVIESSAFDPAMAARVEVVPTTNPHSFLDERFLRRVVRTKRGVAVFVPTRAETEQVAGNIEERWDRITAVYYHGGEPISKLRPFLEGDAPLEVGEPGAQGEDVVGAQALEPRVHALHQRVAVLYAPEHFNLQAVLGYGIPH